MLRLAVTTNAETRERIQEPLAAREIDVRHLPVNGRAIPLTAGLDGDICSTVARTPDRNSGHSHDRDSNGNRDRDSNGNRDRDSNADPDSNLDGDSVEETESHAAALADRFDVGFVYPSRLMEGAVLDAHLSIPWVNDRDAVSTSRNKAGVIAALDVAGLPVPKTTMISNPADEATVVTAAAAFSYPVVIKPNSTTRGIGVTKVGDLDSLLGVVDYLNLVHDYRATGDKSYLIQEYIPDARDYRVMVIDGTYAGAVRRDVSTSARAQGKWKHNVHRGATAESVDLDEPSKRLAERVAETLDIPYLGVDLLESDGQFVVSETNARPTIDDERKYEPDFFDRLASLITRTANDGA